MHSKKTIELHACLRGQKIKPIGTLLRYLTNFLTQELALGSHSYIKNLIIVNIELIYKGNYKQFFGIDPLENLIRRLFEKNILS